MPLFLLAALAAMPLRAQDAEQAPPVPITVPPPVDLDAPLPPPPPPEPTRQARFEAWLADYRATALKAGVGQATLDANLPGLIYNPRVVQLDRVQPDDSRPANKLTLPQYLSQRLTAGRLGQGRRMYSDLSATIAGVEARYGVPGPIVVGIWGMETAYGNDSGSFDVVRALASLAFDGRRQELFTTELTAALKMLDRGDISRTSFRGSWAGATGQSQFMPSSYIAYAADGDGDGRANIWGSQPDTLASIANYLVKKGGWQAGVPWGFRVYVPANLDRNRIRNLVMPSDCERVLSRHSRWIPVREWRTLGFVPLGTTWPADDTLMTLIEPDGPGQGGFLTTGNFRALLSYNCSNFYALSVALLGDALR